MKAKKKKKKPTIPKQVRKLEIQCEKLWKEICFLRDGRQCMVQKLYPTIDIEHAGYLQIDHCITRKNKWFFYEPRNGTVVCGSCNRAKYYKQKSVDRAIDEIVHTREGEKFFSSMVSVDQSMAPNHGWKKVWWLEETLGKLKKALFDEQKKGSNGDPSLPNFLFS